MATKYLPLGPWLGLSKTVKRHRVIAKPSGSRCVDCGTQWYSEDDDRYGERPRTLRDIENGHLRCYAAPTGSEASDE